MSITYQYPRANTTSDIIYQHPEKGILLIKRKNPPDAGKWALPGGHLEIDEKIIACATREFKEEAGFIPFNKLTLVGIFDEIERDPRDRYLSFVFLVQGHFSDPEPTAGDDALDCRFCSLEDLSKLDLAIDHKEIIMNIFFNSYKSHNVLT